jgi:hypothetical protein
MYNSKDDKVLQELVNEIFNPFAKKVAPSVTHTEPQYSEFVTEFLQRYPEHKYIKGLNKVDDVVKYFKFRDNKDLINFATQMSAIGGVDFAKDMKVFMADKVRK